MIDAVNVVAGDNIFVGETNPYDTRIFALAIEGSSFDDRPLEYAANHTSGRYTVVNDLTTLQQEIEDYLIEVCDFVDLEANMTMSPTDVQLEDTVTYDVTVTNNANPTNPGLHKPAYNAEVVINLNTLDPSAWPADSTNIDNVNFTPAPGWTCAQTSPIELVCTLDPGYPIDIGVTSNVVSITAHVPGRYYGDNISGNVAVSSTHPDTDLTNNDTASSSSGNPQVNVVKKWLYTGEELPMLQSFTHIKYNEAIYQNFVINNPNSQEFDYDSDELITNPLQVPVEIGFGAHYGVNDPQYSILITEFCYGKMPPSSAWASVPEGSCGKKTDGSGDLDPTIDDYFMEGMILFENYQVNDITRYIADASGSLILDEVLFDASGPTSPFNIPLGDTASGEQGRYVGGDPTKCAEFAAQRDGGCMDFISTHLPTTPAEYTWSDSEYLAMVMMTGGGNPQNCATHTDISAPECVEDMSAQPGY